MTKLKPFDYKVLRKKLDFHQLNFVTTKNLKKLTDFVGQKRALDALNFGIRIKSDGYNLYAMGPTGVGKRSLIRGLLKHHAKKQPSPHDWCYIHNFTTPDKPIALDLPHGVGVILQKEMNLLIEELSVSLLAMLESDEYNIGMKKIEINFNIQRKKTQTKNPENLEKIEIPRVYKDRHAKEKELQLRFTRAIVSPATQKLIKKYAKLPKVQKYLRAVEKDITLHVDEFIKRDETTNLLSFTADSSVLSKYKINLMNNNSKRKGAPVVFEENPSYSNLIARVEYTNQFGTMVTNFTLIKSGALHRANGGYLIIQARKLKKEKLAWEGLKRALYAKKIMIELVEDLLDSTKPVSLQPMSIPLDVKIILLGDRKTFYSLSYDDPDFSELFKVAVDFDEQIQRNKKNINLYARLIGTIAKREKLKPFHASAVAAIIDYSSRLAEDVEKLSTHIRGIDDLILESAYWSSVAKKKIVDANDVKKALQAQTHRLDRAREQYYEDIKRNYIIIKTSGAKVGQVNCLSVVRVGAYSYGHPTRVTTTVRAGKGKIIDIQREIELSGPIHSKATLTLASFLAARYNPGYPYSLTASISFEQIYGSMDGDSASVGELCALLSAIGKIPIKQSLAVTGSIDQNGQVQVVGGVNEKIEGFFDICKEKGLTRNQGVLIPAMNVKNLMLREDVVLACKQKKFFIYPINTIDEAITLLTGLPADHVNEKVEKQLENYSKNRLRYR